MSNIETDFYKKYIGDFAKRFYTPFKEENILRVVGFKIDRGEAYIEVEQEGNKWFWDMDDSVIITSEPLTEEIERVANINHKEYKGYDPFK